MDGGGRTSKVLTAEAAGAISYQWRNEGLRVVQAHGVFDLLHPGHIRYLQAAKRHGEKLIVTVTSDEFARKAPGRPAFNESLRAETLASLECVDAVAVNDAANAVPLIEKIRPTIYAKGHEYANGKDQISDERKAVERHGGRVVFTDEIIFSSSELINRHLPVGTHETRAYLERAREMNYRQRAHDLIEAASKLSVLFIGETIIDEYVYVSPLGKPPKEWTIAALEKRRETFDGGIIAASRHAASFCAEVGTYTSRTVTKLRVVDEDRTRKLFEVYKMNDRPASKTEEADALQRLASLCPAYDVVVVIDFGHGQMTPRIRNLVREKSNFLAVNAQSNSANHGFNPVTNYGADYICVDAPEARLAVSDRHADLSDCAQRLLVNAPNIVITDGHRGSLAHHSGWPQPKSIPAFADRVVDTMGAGDAFLAVTAPLAALSDDMELIAFIGNIAGGIKVGTVGHRKAVDKTTVLRYIDTLLR